uniref:PHF7/G2E3-like PHD zinc finger domain-containing protein n=1 Tax=Coturnix japonica TaxID=93934 RepID=A0A8C2SWY3_COTJA
MQLPAGAGWGSPGSAGHGPSAPQPGWPVCACRDCSTYHGPFPLASSSPAPHPAWQTRCRPQATVLRGTWHSLLLLFALSSPVCMLCRRAGVHEDICGPLLGDSGLRVHKFCLVSSLGGPSIFHPKPGANECCCCSFQHCFICGEKGASIYCAETDCEHSFHLPCATNGECVTQFFGNHRSFCCEHRYQQIVEAAPGPDTHCVICLEPVGDQKSYHTMVCPVCIQAWFHRSCIQVGALPLLYPAHTLALCVTAAGICHKRWNSALPMSRLQRQGAIPDGNAPPWDPNPSQVGAFNPSYEVLCTRHSLARLILSLLLQHHLFSFTPRPWELLLCTSCAVQGTHRKCASLSDSTISWECDICAAADAGKRQTAVYCCLGARQGLAVGPQCGFLDCHIRLILHNWLHYIQPGLAHTEPPCSPPHPALGWRSHPA